MRTIQIKNYYETTAIPANEVVDLGYSDGSDLHFDEYIIVAHLMENGLWDVYYTETATGMNIPYNDSLDLNNMVSTLIGAEEVHFHDRLSLIPFDPLEEAAIPDLQEIALVQEYLTKPSVSKDNILHLALQIGLGKMLNDKFDTTPVTRPGSLGQYLNLN